MLRAAFVLPVVVLLLACQAGSIVDPLSSPPPAQPPPPPPPPANQPPTARIVTPPIGREGAPFPFSAAASTDPDGDPLTFTWWFGDGPQTADGDSVAHTYRNNGSYVARLIATDSLGAADTTTTTVVIANVEPQITLLKIPDSLVQAGTPVPIEIEYSDPGVDDTVDASLWVGHAGGGEGGGLRGSGTVFLTFFDPGEYTISVIASDNDGAVVQRVADHTLIVVAASGAEIVAQRRGRAWVVSP
jgi:PKD domain-containing protein